MNEVSEGLARAQCRPEKFPHGSKMSATLLIDFLMCARCFSWGRCTQFLHVCVQYVCTCVCFKSHLEQIADSKVDQPLLQDKAFTSSIAEISHWKHMALYCRLKVNATVGYGNVLVISGKPQKKKIDISYPCVLMCSVFSAPCWTCHSITTKPKIKLLLLPCVDEKTQPSNVPKQRKIILLNNFCRNSKACSCWFINMDIAVIGNQCVGLYQALIDT